MNALRSALDELAGESLDRLTNEDLVDHLGEIERAVRMLEAERAKVVAEIEERQTYANDGFASTTTWLVHRLRIPASIAGQQTRLARVLRHMPEANRALAEGAICVSAVALLVAAREADRTQYERCEETLVEAARSLSIGELRRVIDLWRSLGDRQAADEAARRRFERRGLFISATLDGMVRLDGNLGSGDGADGPHRASIDPRC